MTEIRTTAQEPSHSGTSRLPLSPYRNVLFFPSRPKLLRPEGQQPPPLFLYAALIQGPCRRWTKPWRQQRTVCLFAESAYAMRRRLHAEGRVPTHCFVLQVFRVKGGL